MSAVPYSTPKPRDRISAMYDTKIISPTTNDLLVWSNSVQAWENLSASAVPGLVQNLSQVLTVGNSATNQNISNVNNIRANQFEPNQPTSFDTPNDGSVGLYTFKIQTGSYNQNTLSNIAQAALQNGTTGFPTEQISSNLDNKSVNADTRIMSQFIDYTAPLVLGSATTIYCLNFGTQLTGNDECYYDPMNMRVFYDLPSNSWIACGTPAPYNINLILGSWTITVYLVGVWSAPSPNNQGRIILEQWRAGVLYKSYPVMEFNAAANLTVGHTATFVLSGLFQDDWIPNTDEWRATITNINPVQTFTIEKLNMTFEWRQLS